jgi:DNA-binding response OmpR family regulator
MTAAIFNISHPARTPALRPDVVLLDLALPDIDGRDVCRRLRHEWNVPITMITASGTVTDRVVGLELGADEYVVKPFATAEIVARIPRRAAPFFSFAVRPSCRGPASDGS